MRAVGVGSGKVNVQRAAALQALAAALRRVAYGPERLRECLGVRYPDDVGLLNHAPAVARCAGSAAADIAARLFYLENPESPAAVRRLLGAADTRALTEAGLLRAAAGRLRARLRVDVHGGLLLLADRRFAAPDATALGLPRGDMVYPPGTDSVMLAEAVPTREGERVLDLCTGSGIQALQVAPRAAGVTAVDIGLRAAALARCNAALNGIVGVTVRQGDLYAPVRGEQFDLVIANPPFVPARRRGPAYHSGGPRGDRVLRRVVAGLEAHLRPGGRAIAISHLALRRGETLQSAVGPWLRGFAGRALIVVLERGTPIDLAAAQSLFALEEGLAAYGREVRDWLAYLHRQRIGEVVALLLVAERGPRRRLEVRDGAPRSLPIPLSQPPPVMVKNWLAGS